MGLARKLRSGMTYANVISSIALFVALSGGAYALSVPKHSVGSPQLRRGAVTAPKLHRGAVTTAKLQASAVTSAQVRDHSLRSQDLAPGTIPTPAAAPAAPVLGGVRAADLDPPATALAVIKSAGITMSSAGPAFVLATLRDTYLTCGTDPCEADWGVYVDGQPVSGTGLRLQAGASGSDGYTFYTLYGFTSTLAVGSHTVTVAVTPAGNPASYGQLGAQLGALALD